MKVSFIKVQNLNVFDTFSTNFKDLMKTKLQKKNSNQHYY